MTLNEKPRCAFCGRAQNEVQILIQGQDAFICADCVLNCQQKVEERAAKGGESEQKETVPAEIAMATALHRARFWLARPYPTPPDDAGECDLPPDKREELRRVLQIAGMIKLKPSGGWNERSVNRRAQHRWPESNFIIEDVYTIVDTWLQFGLPGLVEMVRQGRQVRPVSERVRVSYIWVRHAVKDMAALEVRAVPNVPVFISTSCDTMLKCHPELCARLYLIALESQFGRYRFGLVHYQPPTPMEVEDFACVATRLGP